MGSLLNLLTDAAVIESVLQQMPLPQYPTRYLGRDWYHVFNLFLDPWPLLLTDDYVLLIEELTRRYVGKCWGWKIDWHSYVDLVSADYVLLALSARFDKPCSFLAYTALTERAKIQAIPGYPRGFDGIIAADDYAPLTWHELNTPYGAILKGVTAGFDDKDQWLRISAVYLVPRKIAPVYHYAHIILPRVAADAGASIH